MSEAEKNITPDSDAPAGPELTKGQLRYLKRKEYLKEYARKNGHKRNTGRPPGRPPKPKQTEPARPKNHESVWSPQYREDGTPGPQFALLSCPFPEIFFGGARGGGKTDGAIGKWLQHAHRYGPDAKGVFFRRRFKQLEEVQARCSALFPRLGASYHKGDANWVFPNGALLKLRHLWDVSATEEYQGHNYSWLCFEELTNWSTPDAIDRMRGTLRSAKGVPVELIMTGNPGGSGHSWVKQRYISPAPQGWTPIKDEETGAYRIYIPSRLEDNTAMMRNDPTYAARLRGTGSAALVNAWLKGDWDIVAGGFFDDLILPDTHFLTPFHIPSTWSFRRSFDWGSASPASLGIWAVSDGNPVPDLDGFTFPRGSLIRIKEWYTCAKTKTGDIVPNEGLRLTNLALGEGIAQRSLGYRFGGCVADPSIYSKLGRESIYDEMRKGAADAGQNLIMSPADNNRIGGWQKVRDMLENARADRPEKPGLWVFESCHHWLRTVPVMQRSDTDFDDVDTTQEDHCLHGDTLVETRDGVLPIRDLVGTVGEARQADGSYMIFWGCRQTRKDADTVTVTTKDRRSVTCTPDHRILTTDGWVEARDTLGKTIVCAPTSTPRAADGGPEVVSIEDAGQHDVFNLEVEHTHAFAVNGGLIVHNCADDTRYVCMTGARQLKIGALIGR